MTTHTPQTAPQVTIYTKDRCAPCRLTKGFLTSHNISFKEVALEGNEDEVLTLLKSHDIASFPGVFASGAQWGGYNPDRLRELVAAVEA